jgi:hypothetical protein
VLVGNQVWKLSGRLADMWRRAASENSLIHTVSQEKQYSLAVCMLVHGSRSKRPVLVKMEGKYLITKYFPIALLLKFLRYDIL